MAVKKRKARKPKKRAKKRRALTFTSAQKAQLKKGLLSMTPAQRQRVNLRIKKALTSVIEGAIKDER